MIYYPPSGSSQFFEHTDFFGNTSKKHIDPGLYYLIDDIAFMFTKVPQKVLEEIKPLINSLKTNFSQGQPMNNYLVGHIQHEYSLQPPPLFLDYIQKVETHYSTINKTYYDTHFKLLDPYKEFHLNLEALWVNFQQKYEYNPSHNHSGLYSFVLWYDIPYLYEDEVTQGPGSTDIDELSLNGCFAFQHSDSRGRVINVPFPIDKRYNGYLAFFPASLYHQVYPFYSSNNYRTTIAGNIHISYN